MTSHDDIITSPISPLTHTIIPFLSRVKSPRLMDSVCIAHGGDLFFKISSHMGDKGDSKPAESGGLPSIQQPQQRPRLL